jgi:hypothetical protein
LFPLEAFTLESRPVRYRVALLKRAYCFFCLLVALVAGCGNSSMNDFVTGDVVAEDLDGTSRIELRLDLTREETATRDIRKMRFSGFNSQGNLVYGPTERDAADRLELNELPRFTRTLQIEYLSGSDAIVVGQAEVKLLVNQDQFAPRHSARSGGQRRHASVGGSARRQHSGPDPEGDLDLLGPHAPAGQQRRGATRQSDPGG